MSDVNAWLLRIIIRLFLYVVFNVFWSMQLQYESCLSEMPLHFDYGNKELFSSDSLQVLLQFYV